MKDISCFRKEAYKTLKIATKVKGKREAATGIPLRIYECENHFHLTKSPTNPI